MAAPFDCTCRCHSPGIAFIPIAGAWWPRVFKFAHLCGTETITFLNEDMGNVWTGRLGTNEDGSLIPVTVTCNGETIEVDATLTISGLDRGQVKVELKRKPGDGGTLVVQWISLAAVQPHCMLQMKREKYDIACGCDLWNPFQCLTPFVQTADCALCNGDHWALKVKLDLHSDVIDDEIEAFVNSTPWLAEQGVPRDFAYIPCAWTTVVSAPTTVEAPWLSGTKNITIQVVKALDTDFVDGLHQAFYLTVNSEGVTVALNMKFPIATLAAPGMPQWCLEESWTAGDESSSAKITAVRIRTTRSGFTDSDCILGVGNYCQGASIFEVRRTRRGEDSWLFDWKPISNTCEGGCLTPGRCVPMIPTGDDVPELPETAITQAEAEGLGIWSLVGEQYVSLCGCGAPYLPTSPGKCWWVMDRVLCSEEDGTYVYGWTLIESTCAAGYEPVPPHSIITTPITEAAAAIEGYDVELGELQEGWCEFGAPAYEFPSCGDEPCGGNCSYVIAGYTSANGTFGTQDGSLIIDITTPGVGHEGYVYLNVSSNDCTTCNCPAGTKHISSFQYWGPGGFPNSGVLVGSPGGTFDCE